MNTPSEIIAAQTILRALAGFMCEECGHIFDDANEWAYGHDCE